jgi:hypothetical protein
MINLMVVNKTTRLPGKGADRYIKEYCWNFLSRNVDLTRLSLRQKKTMIESAHAEIFDFPGWSDMLRAYGLEHVRTKSRKRARSAKPRQPNPNGWSTGPEGEGHKNLKARIARTPALVGLHHHSEGRTEEWLWSGDRADVYFETAALSVEVKADGAAWDELHRGIFQCVKYKAVLRAQQIHDRVIPTADCILALGGRLPSDLKDLAQRLGIRYVDGLG